MWLGRGRPSSTLRLAKKVFCVADRVEKVFRGLDFSANPAQRGKHVRRSRDEFSVRDGVLTRPRRHTGDNLPMLEIASWRRNDHRTTFPYRPWTRSVLLAAVRMCEWHWVIPLSRCHEMQQRWNTTSTVVTCQRFSWVDGTKGLPLPPSHSLPPPASAPQGSAWPRPRLPPGCCSDRLRRGDC